MDWPENPYHRSRTPDLSAAQEIQLKKALGYSLKYTNIILGIAQDNAI